MMKISRIPDIPKNKVKPDLELGESYKLQVSQGDNRKPDKKQDAKLVYLDEKIAVFDNGKYKNCQMIKNYKVFWEAWRI